MEQHMSRTEGPDYSNSSLDSFEIRTQRDSFYRETVLDILGVCGNERRHSSMNYAIDILNHRLDLDLHPVREEVLKMLSHELLNANRFGGNIFIEPELGENSAVHSCHTAILMNEIFRRAGLLDAAQLNADVTQMRRAASEACLIHDMGELLGEFNTLTQRIADTSLSEDANVERKVFETALRLALLATDAYGRKDMGPLISFFRELDAVRRKAAISEHSGVQASADINQLLEKFEEPAYRLNARLAPHARHFLKLFDITEIHEGAEASQRDLFLGYLVKTVEHIQGTRHFVRFAHKADDYRRIDLFSPGSARSIVPPEGTSAVERELTIPVSLASSAVLVGGSKYMESSIGGMFKYAKSSEEKALASAARDACYQTMIEWLNAMNPLVDRGRTKMDPVVVELTNAATDPGENFTARSERVKLVRRLLEQERKSLLERARADRSVENYQELRAEKLFDVETRGRLISLYKKAIEVGYEPEPGEVLLTLKKLPAALAPLEPLKTDWWESFQK